MKEGERGRVLLDWADEARVVADVDETSAGPEQAPSLRRESGEIVDVGVRECREGGVERRVLKRHRGCVGVNELRPRRNSGREPELVGGDVDAGDLPTQIRRDAKEAARAATEVDAAARPRSQQPAQQLSGKLVVRRVGVEELRVLIGETVVPAHTTR
jgi:hypothetical protein